MSILHAFVLCSILTSTATEPTSTAASQEASGPARRGDASPARREDTSVARPEDASSARAFTWDARAAEHLLNRAAFGARPNEIQEALALGPEKLVDRLLTRRADVEPPFVEVLPEPGGRALKELSEDEQKRVKREYYDNDRRQLLEYTGWWFESMVSGRDPLLDRMTLFWHGLMTSSIDQVRRSYPMLKQNQFLRANALGRYSDLLDGIVKDPAMLTYLNGNSNRKGNPNENLARELMELFSLGIGNYTETDVKEAARALTGRGVTRDGEYEYRPKQHDDGEKTILGDKGKHDGDSLVKVILRQDACPRYVARKLITYFEGVEPDAQRLESYATFLRANDFQIQPFLKKLFLDPAFYRDEVVGARVQSPVDFMVGTARRLGLQAPAMITGSGAALLGQRLFAPPSVKGWDEGLPWITTSSLMQRGNLAGMMLGVVRMDDVLSQADLLANDATAAETGGNRMAGTTSAPKSTGGDGAMQGGGMSGDTLSGGGMSGGAMSGGTMSGGAMQDGSMSGGGAASGGSQDKTKAGADAKPADAKVAATSADARAASDSPASMDDAMSSREKREEMAKRLKSGKKGGFAYDALRRAQDAGWSPSINFTARMQKLKLTTDEQIVDQMLSELLAIVPPAETRAKMLSFLTTERVQLSLRDGHLLDGGADAEHVLRRLAHLILSLPDAQLM